jgi:hypothetical protein
MTVLAGCPRTTNPPPDIDTGGLPHGEGGDAPPADVVNDGVGRGRFRRVLWGALGATPIGSPTRAVDGNASAGHVALVLKEALGQFESAAA